MNPPPPAHHIPDWQKSLGGLLNSETYLNMLLHLVELAVILLAARLLVALGRIMVNRAMRPLVATELGRDRPAQAARIRTLSGLMGSVIRYLVYFLAMIGMAGVWNVHILGVLGTAVGTAGILGIVVGMGAQKLVRDVITGVFILMEDQYSVGDTVTIGVITGVVEEVGVRVTYIRDEIGRLNMLPNGDINTVINHSRGNLDATVEVGVAPLEDLEYVYRKIAAASSSAMEAAESPLVGAACVQGITAMDGTKVTLRIVASALPGRQKAAEMALRAAIRNEFQAAGIGIV